MGITILRPSTRVLAIGTTGIRIIQPGGGALPWWMAAGVTPLVAYQAKGAASYAASKANLVNPGTYDATEGVAPNWSSGAGWSFNGSTQWLYVPGVVMNMSVPTLRSMVIRVANGATGSGVYAHGGELFWISLTWFGSVSYRYTSIATAAPQATAGVFAITPSGGYRNGSLDVALTPSTFGLSTGIAIGTRATNAATPPAVSGFVSGDVLAFALWDGTLDAAQVAATSAAMAAL